MPGAEPISYPASSLFTGFFRVLTYCQNPVILLNSAIAPLCLPESKLSETRQTADELHLDLLRLPFIYFQQFCYFF